MATVTTPDTSALLLKLGSLVALIVPAGTPVLPGPLNRVAQPAVDHVLMTPIFWRRLRTNVTEFDGDYDRKTLEEGIEQHVQVDFYGPAAQTWAVAFSTLMRDETACDALAPDAAPLFADDARTIPLTTGEEQYLARASVTAQIQYNPVTVLPQQFADQATVTLVEVDSRFPP